MNSAPFLHLLVQYDLATRRVVEAGVSR